MPRDGAAGQVQPDAFPPEAWKALLPQGRAQPLEEGEATMCMLNGEKQQEFGGKGNRLIPVNLAMNFSPLQHFGMPTFKKAALP
jgi:hypothetical protein